MKSLKWITGLAFAAIAHSAAAQAVAKELAPIQGTWNVVTINGGAAPGISATFTGGKYTQSENGTVVERGSFKIDATKKPQQIDLSIEEGQDKGKVQLGLVEVVRDTLKLNLAAPGGTTRPASMTAPAALIVAVKKK
jgi:uncharacterized protein (TIGR03067 family)